jgi:hypothetical protein
MKSLLFTSFILIPIFCISCGNKSKNIKSDLSYQERIDSVSKANNSAANNKSFADSLVYDTLQMPFHDRAMKKASDILSERKVLKSNEFLMLEYYNKVDSSFVFYQGNNSKTFTFVSYWKYFPAKNLVVQKNE